MHLDHFISRAVDLFPDCTVGNPSCIDEITNTEERFGISFPEQVREFYLSCNGVLFPSPFLNILPLSELQFTRDKQYLVFCLISDHQTIGFDTSKLNTANQWSIVGIAEHHQITFTMASFWSSKVWRWVERYRPIWNDSEYH